MGADSHIQWTDHTFNPWIGCTKVAPECKNCYAETLDRNRYSKTLEGTKDAPISHWGKGAPRHRTSASNWKLPHKWNRYSICERCGWFTEGVPGEDGCGRPDPVTGWCEGELRRPRVFCASLSDWLDDDGVPIEWLADLLKLIHDTPNLDWLLLTKRPQNFVPRLCEAFELADSLYNEEGADVHGLYDICEGWLGEKMACSPTENVWIGVSAGADQAAALAIPARIHFLSCEPMLKPMDETHAAKFDWIIFGGESGKGARPCVITWIRDGVKFCRSHGVAPFVKQLGSNCAPHNPVEDGRYIFKDKKGGDMDEWPDDLRVREFPKL